MVELSLRKTVRWSSRSEKLHIPLPCSHIAAPGSHVCQHHVSAWAEGDGFSIGGRAVTTSPATSVLLHPGKINVSSPGYPEDPLDPLDHRSKNTLSHPEDSSNKCSGSGSRTA